MTVRQPCRDQQVHLICTALREDLRMAAGSELDRMTRDAAPPRRHLR
jgi:hypothetical protein